MAASAESPSSVMYDCFKQFASLSIKEVANTVFAEGFSYGGVPIRARFEERTFLTRVIKNAQPGDFNERSFSDFPTAAMNLCAKVLARKPGKAGKDEAVRYFAGEACETMCDSLRAYGLNDILYRNIIGRVEQMELSNDVDKVTLLLLQFVATGCLGDPARAAQITQDFSRRILMSDFRTQASYEGDHPQLDDILDADLQLGLCRILDGKLRMPAFVLSTDEAGTEIGSLASSSSAINDVDAYVSKRHARVYRDASGAWYVVGLGSTNGTTVIRGDTKEEQVVELPRSQRSDAEEAHPVRIYPSDILRLGYTTDFMVLELAD